MAQLVCLGRHTVTGLLTTSGHTEVDWTADYRLYSHNRLDMRTLFEPVLNRLCASGQSHAPIVVAMDDTRLHKCGRHIHGVRYARDPLGPAFHTNLILAQRFLQISMASIDRNDPLQMRMIPVDIVHAPSVGKAPKNASEEQRITHRQKEKELALGQIGVNELTRLRSQLDAEGHQDRLLWAVVDGGYTHSTVLKQLPERTRLTGRIRKDAKFFHQPVQQPDTGRRRLYGDLAPTPEQLRTNSEVPWQHVKAFACGKEQNFKVKTIEPILWKKAGVQMPLRLVVIAPLGYRLSTGHPLLYRKPAYLICTDPNADLQQIIQTYIYRSDIENNFRDQKTLLGLGQAQIRHEKSVQDVPVLATAAYAMLLCAASKITVKGKPSNPKWRKPTQSRAPTTFLLNHLRYELWADRIRFDDFVCKPSQHTKSQKPIPSLCSSLFRAAS